LLRKKPFLGICVGMQVLADKGFEFGEHSGFGWIGGVVNKIISEDYNAKMILQIHDELIFEVKKNEINKMTKIIKEEMISVANSDYHSFSIPLTVDINSGDNWGALH